MNMKISARIAACFTALTLIVTGSGCQTSHSNDSDAMAVYPTDVPAISSTNLAESDETVQYDKIILRSGDVVKISVPSTPSLNGTHLIRRDGNITLDMVGELRAAGKNLEALKADLVKSYSDKIDTKEISVELETSRFPVYVTGAVGHPGKIDSDHPITALEAIMESGGFDYTRANLKDVRVFRLEKGKYKSFTINLKEVMRGNSRETLFLKPQDIVYVKERFTWF